VDSTSKEKDLTPFWNAQCAELTSRLWLPTETDLRDLDMNSFDLLSSQMVQNLIDELHHKAALFFVKNFDCILLPTFATSQMVSKAGRKISNKTVRNLLTFAHYRFKQFLKNKAFEYGKTVLDVCEAYTSKTHPETGEIKQIGGAKRIRLLSGEWVNRDVVGARNILLRALVDMPHVFNVAVNNS
jgi:putative transposase